MSSGAPKFSEKKLAELLADARQQGLPEDWTLNTDVSSIQLDSDRRTISTLRKGFYGCELE